MKIGIIQGTSQKSKNPLLEKYIKEYIKTEDQLYNFGVYQDSQVKLSYVQISLAIALLINSQSVDFVVTGCSSGQGMMLACNTFPNIQCGYIPTPSDSFLFAQINNGNVASFPLGLNWGWSGELNFKNTIHALFEKKFGQGYPTKDATRKLYDTSLVKSLNQINKKSFLNLLSKYDHELINPVLNYDPVYNFIVKHGKNAAIINEMKLLKFQVVKKLNY